MIGENDLQGHWRRDWIKAPGFEDHTTRVHWLQAGALYADIRVPLERPDLPGKALCEATPEVLRALMEAEAFAGAITVARNVCTWARVVNWHGQPDGIDAGAMHFEGEALIETGVLSDYVERWRHSGAGLTARKVTGGGWHGVLVGDTTRFLLVMGVPDAPTTAPMVASLDSGTIPTGCAEHFAQPCAMGHWDGDRGVADLALNPFAEGTAVLSWSGGEVTAHWPDFDGRKRSYALSQSAR